MDDANYADLLPALSPLDDPDAAMLDRKGAMDKLLGPVTPEPQSWLDKAQASDAAAQRLSPNGNVMPDGLNSRVAPQTAAPTPAVPAGVTPSGKTSGLADSNTALIGQMQSDYTKASQDVQREADQPDLATTTAPLQAQRAKDAAPIPAYDPQTGKVLSQYKPSFGQRLMRGVEGFAGGGVLGVLDPKIGGAQAYGAPNAQYRRDVATQQAHVASDDQQLSNAAANWKLANDRIKQVAADRRAQYTGGKDVTGAAIAQQKIPIEQQNADTATQNANTKEDKPDAAPKTYEQAVIAANQETDPVKKAAYQAAADQIQKAEVRRFQASAPKGPVALPNGTGDSTKGGAAYLATLPTARASLVKEIGEGRGAPPNSRSKDGLALMADVTQAYPDYDATKYPTYAKTRAAFTSGKEGQGINAFSTALRHLDSLESHIPDNSQFTTLNWLQNTARTPARATALKPFEADALAVSNEVEKAYKGGALSKEDYEHMRSLISENDSPKTLKSGISELRNLLQGKLQSYQEQWDSAMPAGSVSPLKTISGKSAAPSGGFDWNAHPEAK